MVPNAISAEITQESESAIRCWCYEQHRHCNNSCNGNVSHGAVISQHTDERCQLGHPLCPRLTRYAAPGPLSEDSLVPTAMGKLRAGARAARGLSGDR